MTEIFTKILNMGLAGAYVIAAVIIIRLLLKKTPRWVYCAIWGIAALRLTMPFDIKSAFGIMPRSEVSVGNIGRVLESVSADQGKASVGNH
jgi:hypothetical protein